MDFFPYLSEVQSSLVELLLVASAAIIVPLIFHRDNETHRRVLLVVSALLILRYAWWRGSETLSPPGFDLSCFASWFLYAIEMFSLTSSLSALAILSRTKNRAAEADAHAGWWAPGPAPKVAVLIATYNEEYSVLERTIVGALALDYPDFEVMVLDDGRRTWLGEYCARMGVRYITRPDNLGAKSGNMNHALAELARDLTPPEFIGVLDADFVPHRNFLTRTIALCHDPKVALVATPQHFFNADPIQHNLGLGDAYPDEQRLFFDHLQPSRDAWGIPVCAGTSTLIRWQAIQDIGGFSTDTVTEDFMVTLTLQEAGWNSVYLCEALSEGLAPEGLKEYITQRARWCLGMMQIARSKMGPLSRNRLRLRDRWSALDAIAYWFSTFPFRIAALFYPLLYWFCNVTAVNASVAGIISNFGVYYFWTLMTLNFLTRGLIVPIISDVSQLIAAGPITRAAFAGMFNPHGHPFKVTAKGGDRSKVVVQWRLMAPFAVLLALTLLGLTLAMFSDKYAYFD
ncbi:MAG: glycosyltransferase, partial [Paracoccaceae bacterium]